jgi:hypothetical protein
MNEKELADLASRWDGVTKGRYEIEDWRHDQRVIQDAHRRIRRSGRNILRIPALKVKYPHIDNYTI